MSIDIPLGPARYHSFASANQPEEPMAAKDFVASHVKDAVFVRGLRPFFDYRDLGIRKATHGRVVATSFVRLTVPISPANHIFTKLRSRWSTY